ncbi:AraC family transcriptional regulator [Flavobacterium sp. Arc3]|uniref:helix-turn-helix domain-containing protein n=1 Tax=Flavobacterium sp. Arc3 TaxID=3046686 RepID=UPI00352F0CFD
MTTANRFYSILKKTVKEIALEMNFQDPYYFSRVFKNKTGLSPTKYRQNHQ